MQDSSHCEWWTGWCSCSGAASKAHQIGGLHRAGDFKDPQCDSCPTLFWLIWAVQPWAGHTTISLYTSLCIMNPKEKACYQQCMWLGAGWGRRWQSIPILSFSEPILWTPRTATWMQNNIKKLNELLLQEPGNVIASPWILPGIWFDIVYHVLRCSFGTGEWRDGTASWLFDTVSLEISPTNILNLLGQVMKNHQRIIWIS